MLVHVRGEIHQAVGIAPLVVVPSDELHKCVREGDASTDVEYGRGLATDEVRGHHLLVRPIEDALHGASSGLLDSGDDVVILGALLQAASQVHDRDIGGGHPEGHAGELTVDRGDNLAHRLSGARRGWDDILRGTTTATPVLATTARAIDRELRGGHGMHRCHEALHNAKLLVHDLCERCQAIRGARGVRDDSVRGLVVRVVHPHNIDRHRVLRRGRNENLLCTSLDVQLGLRLLCENSRGLANVVGAGRTPRNARRILLVKDHHVNTIND
mmetsp:Transcript_88705/g.197175  ORF Transcript_88705/g.197175 Transcript_88705/m.197175 type:complete len:271 (-) Transcript_88705:130-942(-)